MRDDRCQWDECRKAGKAHLIGRFCPDHLEDGIRDALGVAYMLDEADTRDIPAPSRRIPAKW